MRQRPIGIAATVLAAACAVSPAADEPAEGLRRWVEAEQYAAQQGSRAPYYSMRGASGGRIVDNDWGGRATDWLRYRFELPAGAARLHVTLRYARAHASEAAVTLVLDGETKRAVTVRLPSTGGWGFDERQWRLAAGVLPAVSKGAHTLEIRSTRAGNNVNFDRVCFSDRPVAAPSPPVPHIEDDPRLKARARRLPPIAFVVQRALGNPDGVVRYHSRPVVRTWGTSIYVWDPSRPGEPGRRIFHDPAGAILDMNLSFDAKRLLFTFRRGYEDNWHVYEIGVRGGRARQITSGPHHDFAPAELPGGRIVFSSTRVESFNVCAQELASCLYSVRRDGSDVRQVTVNTLNDMSPQVLPSGRILYTRWEYVDRDVKWRQSLWTVNPDGTGVRLYFGNTIRDPAVFWQARPVGGRDEVVATFAPHHGWPMGAVGLVTPRYGPEAPRGTGFRWITMEYPKIYDNGRLTQWAYRDPFPVGEGEYLVSYGGGLRGGPVRRFAIYLLDERDRKARLYADAKLSCFYPLPLRPRPVPPRRDLPPRPAGAETGVFILQDVYRGLGESVSRGEIKAIRIMEQPAKRRVNESSPRVYEMAPVLGRASYHLKRCLGVVPVEADGSACFTVPAFRELYFQALDAEGRAVQSMGSATNVAPGEVQNCVGCHERRETAPPAGAVPLAARRPPVEPKPYEWAPGGMIDFVKIVQPVLDRHCVRCHNGPTPKGRLDLSGDKTRFFNMAYDSLFDRGLVHHIRLTANDAQVIAPRKAFAFASPLRKNIERRRGGEAIVPRADRERIYLWIESNSPYYGTHERTRPGTIGGRDLWAGEWFHKKLLPVYSRHCSSCHPRDIGFRQQYATTSTWINLTHPAGSRLLTAHLAKGAGGFGLDKEKDGKKPPTLAGTDDPTYRAMLEAIREGRREMLANPRMDMPGGRPKSGRNDYGSFRGTKAVVKAGS